MLYTFMNVSVGSMLILVLMQKSEIKLVNLPLQKKESTCYVSLCLRVS